MHCSVMCRYSVIYDHTVVLVIVCFCVSGILGRINYMVIRMVKHLAAVEYVSNAHGRGTLECSGRGWWALTTYSSANGMLYPPTTLEVRNLHHNIFSTIIL